jgi:hypothetical protein
MPMPALVYSIPMPSYANMEFPHIWEVLGAELMDMAMPWTTLT